MNKPLDHADLESDETPLYAPRKEVQVAVVIEEIPQTPAERQARAGRPVVE